MKNLLFGIAAISITSCSMKLVTEYENSGFTPVRAYESFGVVKSDTVSIPMGYYIGKVEVKDNGLSINCDYTMAMKQLTDESRRVGGNLLRIDEHREPTKNGSTCHRIKASLYRIPDPRPFEDTFEWNGKRSLVVGDFKGSIEKRPFQAATYTSIGYQLRPRGTSGRFDIQVFVKFDCMKSYFKSSEYDSTILAHEQRHFDIAEIYGRKFFYELLMTKLNPIDYSGQVNQILDRYTHDMSLKQDEYDSEVYEQPEKQADWNAWVKMELDNLSEFASKSIVNHKYSVEN